MAPTENLQSISTNATAARRAHSSAKATILIAEDSDDSRDMMTTLLGLKGYKVIGAQDGIEAIDVALKTLPDLILLDLELPHLDGLAVTKNLRRHPRLRNVPIVIVSGHDPATFRPLALEAGCTEYLLKPLDFAHLDKVLSDFS
jgi:two-component system cell cycle response regulator DivK